MADVFEEVEEQLRTERYRAFALKALPWAAGTFVVAIAIAIAVWALDNYRAKTSAQASQAYSQALEAFEQGRASEADSLWTDVSKSSSKVYKSLALQHLGGLRLTSGDIPAAVTLFDASAAAAPDPLIADAARLKAVYALLDTSSLKDIQARLDPLLKEGRPYRAEAREALAFAKLMAGDVAGARGDFVVISLVADAQQGARERAQAAIALIDSGSAKLVPAAVKAALALPPPMQLAPTDPPAGFAPGQPIVPNAQ